MSQEKSLEGADEMLFSMIVPIYNAEAYLRRCLNSLIREDLLDQYEILLVDDGSTDHSAEICKEYVDKYSNVRYFHKENGGCSSARNDALSRAQGKYLAFVDADDYITPEFFSCMLEAVRLDCDFYVYDSVLKRNSMSQEELVSVPMPYGRISDLNTLYEWLTTLTQNEVWAKIYRSSIVKERNLKFDEKTRVAEELDFLIGFVSSVETACAVNQNWYIHEFRKDGLAGQAKISYLSDFDTAYQKLCVFCDDRQLPAKCKEHIRRTFLENSFRIVSSHVREAREDHSYLESDLFQELLARQYQGFRANLERICLKHNWFLAMTVIDRVRVLYQRYTKRTWE
ncbi:MAG: glycosyltransferase [Lachnospiraceae bacterium]|nr:glycosyltransferase [Lachnospiraceae bacterium]